MTRVLFLFIDGIGLGPKDSAHNPFAVARMPNLKGVLEGRTVTMESVPYDGAQATLLGVDACLGVDGAPQSASGQAALLTGRNVPAETGGHYGPKPNPPIASILKESNIFDAVTKQGGKAALLNAYPPRYFEMIESGRRLYSAIPLAVTAAGIDLMTAEDLQEGRAMSVDFTGEGWVAQPDFPPAPVYESHEAGLMLAEISESYDLTWFDFWPSDIAGHKGSMGDAVDLLEAFDDMLGGLLKAWEEREDLIVLTSDHGNMENLSIRGHTRNLVPALLVGPADARDQFSKDLKDLTDFAPAILAAISNTHIS